MYVCGIKFRSYLNVLEHKIETRFKNSVIKRRMKKEIGTELLNCPRAILTKTISERDYSNNPAAVFTTSKPYTHAHIYRLRPPIAASELVNSNSDGEY